MKKKRSFFILAMVVVLLAGSTLLHADSPITVRARGTMGGEILELRTDGNLVATWTMTTSYQDYNASGTGTIEVHFTNDDQLQNGMDIQVDYIIYNGTTYQAEDQEINTAVYNATEGTCGGSYSEMLECNGYIRFDTGSVVTGDLGDVNADGLIDIVDALLTAQFYVNLNPPNFDSTQADADCNGSIDIVDALLMAQLYVGLISSFPCSTQVPTPAPTPTQTPIPEPTPPPSSVFHVFILLGQSNMAGYAKAQAADKVEDSRIQVLGFDSCSATGRQTDQWDIACPPLHDCWNDAIGPGDWFAKTLIQSLPQGDTIGLVPCAISGEKIETFMKVGGSKYSWIINRARLAQQAGGIIEGFLFHQGESNNGDPAWPGKVNTFVTDLRTDLGIGNVPFLAGELLYSGGCAGHNTLVNQLPGIISNCYVVSANGLVVDPSDTTWNLHFSHDSTVTFGIRYAEKMITALGL